MENAKDQNAIGVNEVENHVAADLEAAQSSSDRAAISADRGMTSQKLDSLFQFC